MSNKEAWDLVARALMQRTRGDSYLSEKEETAFEMLCLFFQEMQ